VFVQAFDAKAFDGTILKSRNIVGAFRPEKKQRVLLAAHWDTRPFADQDSKDKDKPIDGANDGASGVGVLLEIARILRTMPVEIGVDIILFDAEDYGQPSGSAYAQIADSYCLGSQYWSRTPHVAGYKADFGILLDMVGAKDALFTREQNSVYYADWVLKKVWGNAHRLGFEKHFSNMNTGPIIDDHLYINKIARIPMIDIIQYDPNTFSGFGKYWHTHDDNMEGINKETLNAVGTTVSYTVYQYAAQQQQLSQ
jgi:Zn-dependent M28 family amino/carboxypeptidase